MRSGQPVLQTRLRAGSAGWGLEVRCTLGPPTGAFHHDAVTGLWALVRVYPSLAATRRLKLEMKMFCLTALGARVHKGAREGSGWQMTSGGLGRGWSGGSGRPWGRLSLSAGRRTGKLRAWRPSWWCGARSGGAPLHQRRAVAQASPWPSRCRLPQSAMRADAVALARRAVACQAMAAELQRAWPAHTLPTRDI